MIFANDVIQGKLENAKKENEFIYHEKVPEFDTLPELKGASLVKGVGFEVTDPDVAGEHHIRNVNVKKNQKKEGHSFQVLIFSVDWYRWKPTKRLRCTARRKPNF